MREQLASMRARAEEERAEHEKRKTNLLAMTRAWTDEQMDLLYRDTDRQRLSAERERTSAALEQLVERYAVLAMSMTMIQRTKRVMEEERQPAVIREASRFSWPCSLRVSIDELPVPEGEQTIWLEQADGRLIDSQFLSRGKLELYLAMRFALADEASGAVELPMILDDLLVNFDRNRLEATFRSSQSFLDGGKSLCSPATSMYAIMMIGPAERSVSRTHIT